MCRLVASEDLSRETNRTRSTAHRVRNGLYNACVETNIILLSQALCELRGYRTPSAINASPVFESFPLRLTATVTLTLALQTRFIVNAINTIMEFVMR